MRNEYPKACSVCQGEVPAGEGLLRREGPGWSVTHAEACPRSSSAIGHARAYTRRIMRVLRRADSTQDEVFTAVDGLSALARTGWTTLEACEGILLKSDALREMERLEVETILMHLCEGEESHA